MQFADIYYSKSRGLYKEFADIYYSKSRGLYKEFADIYYCKSRWIYIEFNLKIQYVWLRKADFLTLILKVDVQENVFWNNNFWIKQL